MTETTVSHSWWLLMRGVMCSFPFRNISNGRAAAGIILLLIMLEGVDLIEF